MRRCKKCGNERPLTKFNKNSACRGGRAWTCRLCHQVNRVPKPRQPGGWVRTLRSQLGVSRLELACRLGVSEGTLGLYERGVHPVPQDVATTLRRLDGSDMRRKRVRFSERVTPAKVRRALVSNGWNIPMTATQLGTFPPTVWNYLRTKCPREWLSVPRHSRRFRHLHLHSVQAIRSLLIECDWKVTAAAQKAKADPHTIRYIANKYIPGEIKRHASVRRGQDSAGHPWRQRWSPRRAAA